MAGISARARVAFALLGMFAVELQATLARLFVYCAALGACGFGIAEFVARGSTVTQAEPAEWLAVNRPFAAFAMAIPDFEPPRYSIWRQASGGGRKDILTFGEPGGATAVVEIHRPGTDAEAGDSEDITASISELRLSAPVTPRTIDTKFGVVLVEAFTDHAPHGTRSCLRFNRGFEEPRLELTGWFCNPGPELVDRGMLACALDRLSLLAAGTEPKLAALFARAEIRRSFCGQNAVFVAATPKRTDWIEAARDPKLRH
ncbi:MAG: hypothetical protein E6G97_14015 [Alphaproteobacteria bacterium]|nr:MAG: hypothetical protein E6G97_14015 [Alphaproteobacteria bacterium]